MTVNGKRFETIKGPATSQRVVKLTDLPIGRIRVSITAKTSDGRSPSAKHSYRMCVSGPVPPPTTPAPAPTSPPPAPPAQPAADASSLTSNGSGGYCAILSSSGVKCWGSSVYSSELLSYSNVPVTIPKVGGTGTLSGVKSVASAGGSYCALLNSGEVDCWGNDESNVPVPVQGIGGGGTLSGVKSLVSDVQGSYCAVLNSGGAACWGQNPYGELGNGTLSGSDVPSAVVGPGGTGALSGVESLAPGYYSYCAILTSGGLDCWGFDAHGELGNGEGAGPSVCAGSVPCSTAPVTVLGVGGTGTLTGVASVASTGDDGTAGSYCVAFISGGVACWGWDASKAGGDFSPLTVPGVGGIGALSGVKSLIGSAPAAPGSYCAVLTSGGVDCWRTNLNGQLGNGTGVFFDDVPGPVVGVGGTGTLSGVASLAYGHSSYCAALVSGGVDCWGFNEAGDLGNGTTTGPNLCQGSDPCATTPGAVLGVGGTGVLTGVTSVVGGGDSYCALLSSGGVDC